MKNMFLSLVYCIFAMMIVSQCDNTITDNEDTVDISGINKPSVSTAGVYEITANTAQCGGTVDDNGGGHIQARGLCWSLHEEPTLEDFKTVNGSGTGKFMSLIFDLKVNNQYFVRAYATNEAGTRYGEVQNFTTHVSVRDVDGNRYRVIRIGRQYWMAENLKVTHYRNGDEILAVSDSLVWSTIDQGALCSYANNWRNVEDHGYLYNWYAASDGRNVAPSGWHVPTVEDWQMMLNEINHSGGQLKENSDSYWHAPNSGANNQTGFTALPSGERSNTGRFDYFGFNANFWSSSPAGSVTAYYVYLSYDQSRAFQLEYGRHYGFSIRCVRDKLASDAEIKAE